MADSGFTLSPNTYAGQAAGQFMLASLTAADMLNNSAVYVKETLSNKFTIPTWKHDYTQFVQDPKATPTGGLGAISNGERYLNLGEYLIYQEFNPNIYADHWFAKDMPELLIGRGLPVQANSVVIYEVMRQHATYLNMLINKGNLAGTSILNVNGEDIGKYIDGFVTRMSADSAVAKVTSPVALTNVNVAGEFDRGHQKIKASLRYDPKMRYFCSYLTYDLYTEYQRNVGTQPYKGIDVTEAGVLKFRGKEVVPVADFPEDTFYIAKALPTMESNLWLGVNSTDDQNNLQIDRVAANSDNWFVKGKMKVDVNYVFPDEIVYYGA